MCGDALPSWRAVSLPAGRCPRCRRSPRIISRAGAVGLYDGSLRNIIHAFKYDGRRSLARPLAMRMREGGEAVLIGADFAVPVPLHFRRRIERGFNQAADLAAHIGIPWIGALKRVRATAMQAGLPASRRHANVRNAFAASRRAPMLRDAVVLLIDDVCTTGATLEACARVLKTAGAREVRALTAARVGTSPR
jgi:ComF family protein